MGLSENLRLELAELVALYVGDVMGDNAMFHTIASWVRENERLPIKNRAAPEGRYARFCNVWKRRPGRLPAILLPQFQKLCIEFAARSCLVDLADWMEEHHRAPIEEIDGESTLARDWIYWNRDPSATKFPQI